MNNRVRIFFVAAALCLVPALLGADAPTTIPASNPKNVEDLRAIEARVKEVIRKDLPATVGVLIGYGQGSGVIVSKEGLVLTAGHVAEAPNRPCMLVMPDGKRVNAKTLGVNSAIDSGMIKITDKAPPGGWPFVEIGSAADLKSGQWTVALGHPGGYHTGRPPVARLGRVLMATSKLIDTDNTLINGDSGGPLFDLSGKLIGIHSRIGLGSVANIHVPIDTYSQTWDRLVAGDAWGKSFLGFDSGNPAVLGVRAVEDDKGVKVAKVVPESPAAKAGIKTGDFISRVGINRRRFVAWTAIATPEELENLMARRRAGETIEIELQRDGKTVTVSAKLEARQY